MRGCWLGVWEGACVCACMHRWVGGQACACFACMHTCFCGGGLAESLCEYNHDCMYVCVSVAAAVVHLPTTSAPRPPPPPCTGAGRGPAANAAAAKAAAAKAAAAKAAVAGAPGCFSSNPMHRVWHGWRMPWRSDFWQAVAGWCGSSRKDDDGYNE